MWSVETTGRIERIDLEMIVGLESVERWMMGRQSDDLSIVVEANRYELIKIADLVCLSFFYHLFIFFFT